MKPFIVVAVDALIQIVVCGHLIKQWIGVIGEVIEEQRAWIKLKNDVKQESFFAFSDREMAVGAHHSIPQHYQYNITHNNTTTTAKACHSTGKRE
jgi:hypothetical protein